MIECQTICPGLKLVFRKTVLLRQKNDAAKNNIAAVQTIMNTGKPCILLLFCSAEKEFVSGFS